MGLREEVSSPLSRRRLLALGAGILAAGTLSGWQSLAASATLAAPAQWVALGSVDLIIAQSRAAGGAVEPGEFIQVPYRRPQGGRDFVFVRFSGGEEGLQVLLPYCTNQAARVVFIAEQGEFYCPCHGERYTREGRACAEPGEAALGRLPWRVRKGVLWIRVG